MKISLGIPDDTPENTVTAIVKIIEEEALLLGAEVEQSTEQKDLSHVATITVTREFRSFQIVLSYVESQYLDMTYASIGNGFVSWGPISGPRERYDLELLSKNSLHSLSRPFRWGVYEEGKYDLEVPPLYILDGGLLRSWLRRLQPSAPSSSY